MFSGLQVKFLRSETWAQNCASLLSPVHWKRKTQFQSRKHRGFTYISRRFLEWKSMFCFQWTDLWALTCIGDVWVLRGSRTRFIKVGKLNSDREKIETQAQICFSLSCNKSASFKPYSYPMLTKQLVNEITDQSFFYPIADVFFEAWITLCNENPKHDENERKFRHLDFGQFARLLDFHEFL